MVGVCRHTEQQQKVGVSQLLRSAGSFYQTWSVVDVEVSGLQSGLPGNAAAKIKLANLIQAVTVGTDGELHAKLGGQNGKIMVGLLLMFAEQFAPDLFVYFKADILAPHYAEKVAEAVENFCFEFNVGPFPAQ